ncbi:MAG: PH domain-containing protein [Bacteroidales bacterium]
MNNTDFSIPQRQSPKGIILFFGLTFKKIFKAIWPVFVLILLKSGSVSNQKQTVFYAIIAVFFVILIVNAILSYLNFYFFIKNDELVVEKGYLKKIKLSIPLDKIQTINTHQNFIQQLLNVVAIEIDTAGTSHQELKFHALTKENAEALQLKLSAFSSRHSTSNDSDENSFVSDKKTILQLSTVDLIKVGISENHLKSLLLIYLFVNGIYQQLHDFFKTSIDSASEQAGGFLENSGMLFITLLAIFFLGMLIIFSVLLVILQYFDLNFSRQDGAFVLKSGLLNKKDIVIPYSKIQIVSWETNPIRKWMDFVSVHITQASNSQVKKKQAIIIPGCSSLHLQNIQSEIFPDTDTSELTKHLSHPMYFIRLWIFRIFIVAIPLILIFFEFWYIYVFMGAWVIISALLSYLSFKKRYFIINPQILQTAKGTIEQEFSRFFNYKIQTIKFKQNIFQRRRNLASVVIYISGGKRIKIPYIHHELATELYNYLLYCTESNNKKWM